MANINKISGITVAAISKIKGLAKTALLKAKGKDFGDSLSTDSEPGEEGTFLEELSGMAFPYFGGTPPKADLTNSVLNTYTNRYTQINQSGVPSIDTSATKATFSMWFRPASSRTGLYSNSGNSSTRNFSLYQYSTTSLRLYSPLSNGVAIDLTNQPISLNQWNHIVVTFSSDVAYSSTSSKNITTTVHLNGSEVHTESGSSTKVPRRNGNDGKHVFGALNYNGNISQKGEVSFDFVEWVDDVELTDTQIENIYNSGERGYSIADADV